MGWKMVCPNNDQHKSFNVTIRTNVTMLADQRGWIRSVVSIDHPRALHDPTGQEITCDICGETAEVVED